MKNKIVVGGLAFAIGVIASTTSAQAQLGGSPASGDSSASGANGGNYGQSDYQNTQHQATPLYDPNVQNYSSGLNQHSHYQKPFVDPMLNSDNSGLNMVSTAPMAPMSVSNTPIPSGQFSYGFNKGGAQPYYGAYAGMNRTGSSLPSVSTGSVDFNTVDNSGIAPAGMISPGRIFSQPINQANQLLNSIPSQASSASSVYNWLQNSFFGP